MAKRTRRARRYYGIVELPHSNLCADERQTVLAFRTKADRDEWIRLGQATEDHEPHQYLMTCGEERSATTREGALATMREIMPGADGHMLAEIAPWPETYHETLERRSACAGCGRDFDERLLADGRCWGCRSRRSAKS